ERGVERLAEPLCALFLPPTAWPEALLQAAWLQLVRNAAHDSVCACSVDEVCSAVVHRYAEARQIGEGLADRAGRALAASMAAPGVGTPLVLDDVKADVLERAGTHPDPPVHVRILQPPSRTVLAHVDGVPGFGWTTWAPSPLPVPPAVANGATIENGIVSVEV